MANSYEPLALKFAPEFYFLDTKNPFKNIRSDDMGGLYWRPIPSSVPWADVCIQYVMFFKQQQWVPSILVRILEKFSGELGKLPGNHLNDYVPLFLYFKNERPVRAVFDICHYEVVGVVDNSSGFLPLDGRSKFLVENFYRGLSPLEVVTGYANLPALATPLSPQRLDEWWRGLTYKGFIDFEARFIIKKKFKNPFQDITTFRDYESRYGDIFHWIFWLTKKDYPIQMRGQIIDSDSIASQVEAQMGDVIKQVSHEEIKELVEFVDQNIFKESNVPEYVVLRPGRKFQRV